MIRSTLAAFWKQLIGLVRRRTSRNALSIAFVVRIFDQCILVQLKKESISSISASKHLTAFGSLFCHCLAQSLKIPVASLRVSAAVIDNGHLNMILFNLRSRSADAP